MPSKLSEADKFDLQLRKRSVAPTELYALTRCCGSLTTFNILFKNKDDQFRSSGIGKNVAGSVATAGTLLQSVSYKQEYALRYDRGRLRNKERKSLKKLTREFTQRLEQFAC